MASFPPQQLHNRTVFYYTQLKDLESEGVTNKVVRCLPITNQSHNRVCLDPTFTERRPEPEIQMVLVNSSLGRYLTASTACAMGEPITNHAMLPKTDISLLTWGVLAFSTSQLPTEEEASSNNQDNNLVHFSATNTPTAPPQLKIETQEHIYSSPSECPPSSAMIPDQAVLNQQTGLMPTFWGQHVMMAAPYTQQQGSLQPPYETVAHG
eukprot:Protomagalhaensia_wolfi_Nauph_80__3479@NODE_3529_length_773_cov_24_982289_g2775_i0_p1_GENE_NODE_3529_length_773_cov_24_982289_g2775_i0NODE_3529_length_773_cov_24_982289_g2775_i0_p1_ORF_typecomplete_len217_score35_52_NODE_3529_length_773_cov_24_982289_g2775_i0121747